MVYSGCPLSTSTTAVSVLALSSRFDGRVRLRRASPQLALFQYSLCRVVLMVFDQAFARLTPEQVSVLALSSRFDGRAEKPSLMKRSCQFQYSLCRVVLMVSWSDLQTLLGNLCFSTRSVESF